MEERILVVLPHPDDEAFGMSGTLALRIRGGAQVTYACLTLGEMGRNMGVPPMANRVTLPEIRRQELAESCRAIGIQDLRMLGFHDKMIEFEEESLLDGRIEALLEELQPNLVLTFYPGYSVHPDHDATGAAVIRVVGRMPAARRPVVHCIAFSRNHQQEIGAADVVVDVSEVIDQKMASLRAHRSQFQTGGMTKTDFLARFGREGFWTYRF